MSTKKEKGKVEVKVNEEKQKALEIAMGQIE